MNFKDIIEMQNNLNINYGKMNKKARYRAKELVKQSLNRYKNDKNPESIAIINFYENIDSLLLQLVSKIKKLISENDLSTATHIQKKIIEIYKLFGYENNSIESFQKLYENLNDINEITENRLLKKILEEIHNIVDNKEFDRIGEEQWSARSNIYKGKLDYSSSRNQLLEGKKNRLILLEGKKKQLKKEIINFYKNIDSLLLQLKNNDNYKEDTKDEIIKIYKLFSSKYESNSLSRLYEFLDNINKVTKNDNKLLTSILNSKNRYIKDISINRVIEKRWNSRVDAHNEDIGKFHNSVSKIIAVTESALSSNKLTVNEKKLSMVIELYKLYTQNKMQELLSKFKEMHNDFKEIAYFKSKDYEQRYNEASDAYNKIIAKAEDGFDTGMITEHHTYQTKSNHFKDRIKKIESSLKLINERKKKEKVANIINEFKNDFTVVMHGVSENKPLKDALDKIKLLAAKASKKDSPVAVTLNEFYRLQYKVQDIINDSNFNPGLRIKVRDLFKRASRAFWRWLNTGQPVVERPNTFMSFRECLQTNTKKIEESLIKDLKLNPKSSKIA